MCFFFLNGQTNNQTEFFLLKTTKKQLIEFEKEKKKKKNEPSNDKQMTIFLISLPFFSSKRLGLKLIHLFISFDFYFLYACRR